MDIEVLLDNIIMAAQQAKAAIADENEGRLNVCVDQMWQDMTDVHTTIKNW